MLIWKKPVAAYQTGQPEIYGTKRVAPERFEVQSNLFQEQRDKGNSWSKEGGVMDTAMQETDLMSVTDTSIGSPIVLSPSPLLTPHQDISLQYIENSQSGNRLSALFKNNEDSFRQIAINIQSKVHPIVPTAVIVQMQNLDLLSTSYEQALNYSCKNGMKAIRDASDLDRGKCYANSYQSKASRNQFSSSSVIQDLVSGNRPRSILQQVASYATPASTPCLSGIVTNTEESSMLLKLPYKNELSRVQALKGQNTEKGSQVSCLADISAASKVDLALGLSNNVVENASNNVSNHLKAKDQAEGAYQENADLVGQHLSAHESIVCTIRIQSKDRIVDSVVPLLSKEKMKFLPDDLIWKKNILLQGKNGVKSGKLQARNSRVQRLGMIESEEFDEQLLVSTGQNCVDMPDNSYATPCLVGCDIQMTNFGGQHAKISSTNSAGLGFSSSDCKRMSEGEPQFVSTRPVQEVETQVPWRTHLCEKIAVSLDLNVSGDSLVSPMHNEMENTDYEVGRTTQVECIESHFEEEDAESNSFIHTSLQVSFSGTSSVKVSKGNCVNQENQKFSDNVLHHLSSVRVDMVGEGNAETDMCMKEANSEFIQPAELAAHINKSDKQEHSRPSSNLAKDSSCNSKLQRMEKSVYFEGRDLSESTHLAAKVLLKIAFADMRPLDVPDFSDQRSSLEWFADMIPGNEDCSEFACAASREEVDDSSPSPDIFAGAKYRDLNKAPIPAKESSRSSTSVLDYFESMTLRLPESNEEKHCKPFVKESDGLEKRIYSSLSHAPRTPKRGKRVKDFQKEILLGISTLSRKEVTEDLLTIGGLMRSRGDAFQIGLRQRNSGTLNDDWPVSLRGRRSR